MAERKEDAMRKLTVTRTSRSFTEMPSWSSAKITVLIGPQAEREESCSASWRISGPSSDLLPQFVEDVRGILGGRITHENGTLFFKSTRDGSELPFQWLSSGTQEMLPLMNPLSNLVYNVSVNPANVWEHFSPKIGPIYVEEPELSVFPGTQYELIKLFAWLASEKRLEFPFVITTHSPYILTAFNNLLEAGQVAKAKPELKDEVAKILPERYWIKEGDFNAYAIEDGVLTSIVAKDTGLVSANYLDQVSETIGVEFDELLRLGYVEA
jgi:predicted ATP-binding protein involved in virulence